MPRPGATQQQAHRHGGQGTEQPEDHLDPHQLSQRVAGVSGDTAGGIAGDAGQLGGEDAHLADVGGVRSRVLALGQHPIARGGQFGDQLASVLELASNPGLLNAGDRDAGIGAALWSGHLATLEQHGGRALEHGAALVRVGLDALQLQEHVFDVSLDEGSLPRRDVDDQRGVALVVGGERVVTDHRRDQHQEHRDRQDDASIAPYDREQRRAATSPGGTSVVAGCVS